MKEITTTEVQEQLDKGDQLHLVRSGGRSGRATEFLTAEGYDVTNMVGGMLAWEGKTE